MDDSSNVSEQPQEQTDDSLIEDLDAPAELQDEVAGGFAAVHPAASTAPRAS